MSAGRTRAQEHRLQEVLLSLVAGYSPARDDPFLKPFLLHNAPPNHHNHLFYVEGNIYRISRVTHGAEPLIAIPTRNRDPYIGETLVQSGHCLKTVALAQIPGVDVIVLHFVS